ncbi:hypothetical protein N7510_005981 [Penicillium lagena]|uniref:uncharacterized protein n=1 Tax=Penicillium lagena TaxID=94218 RepID=UPI002541CFE4|nr:uncharacterized protein N7510_005981 [Penicillium lagena]KAJ5612787.1 hypothetical protein N7510_005981 [Penicillium lagena]
MRQLTSFCFSTLFLLRTDNLYATRSPRIGSGQYIVLKASFKGKLAKQYAEEQKMAKQTRRTFKAPCKKVLRLYAGLPRPYDSILIGNMGMWAN